MRLVRAALGAIALISPMRLMWALFGVLAVTALWAATAAANFVSGLALTPDPQLKPIFGAVSLAADVLKVAALFALVGACLNRRVVVASLSLVIFLLCSIHSLRSTFSFVHGEVHAATLTRKADGVASASVVTQLESETRRLSWTAEQSTVAATRKERTIASDEFRSSGRNVEKLRAMITSVRHRSSDDPIAAALGIDDKKAALWSSLFLTLLLELGSGTGFYMLTRAARTKQPVVKPTQRPANDDAPEPDLKPIKAPKPPRKPKQQLLAPPKVDLVVERRTGSTITARAIKAEYERRGVPVTDSSLGLTMRRAGFRKRVSNGGVVYVDCALAA